MNDILNKISAQRLTRGWTEYQLAEKADLPQSTISTWYRKNMTPSFSSLSKICTAFDITLAQFFAGPEDAVVLKTEQKKMLDRWDLLTPKQKAAFLAFLDALCEK